jgi:hypothetical protein
VFLPVLLLFSAALGANAAGNLAIVNAAFQQGEGGSPVPSDFTHVPGEILYVSFQVDHYRVSPAQKVSLTTRTEAVDWRGIPIVAPMDSKVEAELAPEDKEWKPKVGHEVAIPPEAGSGIYKITFHVTDELAKAQATKELTFEVRGHEVAQSETLVTRNFHFYRSEEDPKPLATVAYRPGDTLWARFDITGYKFGPGNKIDLSYGIAVLAPSGKVLWSQPEAAVEKTESFYPKRYVAGSMSLNLQPNIRPGDYAIAVTVRDAIGEQSFEAKQPFHIE